MRAVLMVLAVLLAGSASAAAEWPTLQAWEYTLRTNPPTKDDFDSLKIIGPKWDGVVARYYKGTVGAVTVDAYAGTRAEVWTGIDALRQIDVPVTASRLTDFGDLFEFAKATEPEFQAMGQSEVYRYVLLGQAINAKNAGSRSQGDVQFCLFVILPCGPPPKFPPPPPPPPPPSASAR